MKKYARILQRCGKNVCLVKLGFFKRHIRGLTLSLCCGKGVYMQELLKAGFNVIGLDIDAKLIKYAKSHFKNGCVMGDVHHLPFRDKSFNTVICGNLLQHLKNSSREALTEISRVAKFSALFSVARIDLTGHDPLHLRLYRNEAYLIRCLKEVPNGRFSLERYFSCPFNFLKLFAKLLSRIFPSGYLAELSFLKDGDELYGSLHSLCLSS